MKKMTPESNQRLKNEFMELESKRLKLCQFLEKVGDSADFDVKLLRKQAQVMADYALILETRIKLDDGKIMPMEGK